MSTPTTVTVATLDHGPVTFPEPSWCTGHAEHLVEALVDVAHHGPEQPLMFGNEPLFLAALVQDPFTSRGSRDVGLYVEQTGYAATMAPQDVDALADALVSAASRLRHMARGLAVVRSGGEAR
ncbi:MULTISPECIES: DUF6907 domain-containing protein [unclassified Streptomyces]|uniref:DUF6907 domain-containing protein n=1 Tax=unclassified Streptomyces TaxID=2593676 RepID=UPI003401949E